jgi:hypothetical protein
MEAPALSLDTLENAVGGHGSEQRQVRLLLPSQHWPAGQERALFGSAAGGREAVPQRWRLVDRCRAHRGGVGQESARPALEKALADARLHRASLVVSKVDRLTRSVAFLSRLLEAGVDVRFADLPKSRVVGRHRPHYIAALQAAGARTLRAIADSLNAHRIPTVRGAGQWSAVQGNRVLEWL